MTDWHIFPGLKIDILIAWCRLPVSTQNTERCSRDSASGHLQKFAADLNLSTPRNSQPYKIVTLSLNCNQHFHFIYLHLKSPLLKPMIKISFVLSNQEIVMQHFDLYNNYSILITILCFVKISFSYPRILSEFTLEPLHFPLTNQETHVELIAHFVFLAFEVLGHDEFDTVICLSSASSSSELITISSHAPNCSKDRIHSFCSYNLIA